ncbi:phage tail protein [Pediococcus acidilactici]|uniref:phage tail protein n=1 Tax=Pediococcus acidilactici TaxID=1254 RepID=UPI00232B2396|nr:phage tail protein [Pediococcus acidilactici]MDB8858804.1 phage tail protein [Pediococcus acidilactici]MDB8861094.1 phage tail protein [Pediococcus acidilactici]MDB8862014.1 phage tail protein [Pediococcus acidilactici]MDB8865985.1 phage tail protein [Pediococcus acidilactici]
MNNPVLVQAINSSSVDRLVSFVKDSFEISCEMNGDYTLSFTAYNDGSPAYANLTAESTIKFENTEYVIKQVSPVDSKGMETVSVSATHIFSDTARVYQRNVKKGDHNYSPQDILDFYFKDNKFGYSYEVIGNFSKMKATDLGNGSGKDALSKILELWPTCVIYPDGRKIQVYEHDKFFKNYGHRIDYLNTASEVNFEFDSTEIVNQVRAVGPTYEKTIKTGDSSKLDGTTTAVKGDWGPAIRYAAKLMGINISDSDVNRVKELIQHESGGSETVVNNSDSNAAAGHPSKGLVQFIQSTFDHYAVKPYTNILKGFHQLLALFNDATWSSDIKLGGWGPTGARRRDAIIPQPNASSGTDGAKKVIADAKKYIGVPYVWGGHNKSNPRAGMDCSGFVSQVYHDFGIEIPAYTVAMEKYGKTVSKPQTGDMLFYGRHGASYHVALALDEKTMIFEPQPGQSCRVEPISYFPPSWYARNDKMAAIVAGKGGGDDSGSDNTDATTETTTTENYFDPFIVQDDASIKKWGLHPGGDVTSDSIKNANDMKKWVMTQLKPEPTLSVKVTATDNIKPIMGDMIRLEVRPRVYVANMGVVAYEYYPFSKINPTTITLNQTEKSILDYEKSRNRSAQMAVQNAKNHANDISSGQETWTDEEVGQFGSGL